MASKSQLSKKDDSVFYDVEDEIFDHPYSEPWERFLPYEDWKKLVKEREKENQ